MTPPDPLDLKPCPFCGDPAATRNEQAFCTRKPHCAGNCWAWNIESWNNAYCWKLLAEKEAEIKESWTVVMKQTKQIQEQAETVKILTEALRLSKRELNLLGYGKGALGTVVDEALHRVRGK